MDHSSERNDARPEGTPKTRPIRYAALVAAVTREWQVAHAAQWIEAHVDEGIVVRADPGAVLQILNSLLQHAVKSSPGGGLVRISAWARPLDVVTWVEDRGVGIAAEQRSTVFHRRPAETGAPPPVWNELSTAAELVVAQGGRIWVESEDRTGATFYFSLPRWREDGDARGDHCQAERRR